MDVWLHHWEGNETGWNAWSLDHLGFATWAPSREEVLSRLPGKFEEYRQWLTGHGVVAVAVGSLSPVIIEEISGNEVAFTWDLLAAEPDEISTCLTFLHLTRQDLLATVSGLSEHCLDWEPTYQRYAAWAWWRSIRQILAHCALTEVGYYLPKIGYTGAVVRADASWGEQLYHSRQETERFLVALDGAPDLARVTGTEEVWSVRKVLRRLVWHELLHCKSINRIVRDYNHSYGDRTMKEGTTRTI